MPAKVADASVVGALVFAEPEGAEAGAMLADADLVAPSLLRYELASIARTKIQREPGKRDALLSALRIGLAMDITLVEVDHLAALKLALDRDLSIYDASYL